MKTRKRIESDIKKIKAKYGKDFFVKPLEDFYDDSKHIGLWMSAEGYDLEPGYEFPIADYYNEDYTERYYEMGVLKKFTKFLEKLGYEHLEFYDPGTLMAYED